MCTEDGGVKSFFFGGGFEHRDASNDLAAASASTVEMDAGQDGDAARMLKKPTVKRILCAMTFPLFFFLIEGR